MAIATVRRPQVDAVPAEARRVVTALHALLLTACTAAAVLGAGWTDAQGVIVLIGVLGAASAAAVSLLRPGRLAGILLAPLLLAASIVLPTIGNAPLPHHASGTDITSTYLTAVFTGLGGNAMWAFNVSLGALLWACGAWAVEMSLGARRGALATAPCWIVLAVNVINSPAPAGASFFAFAAAACALLLIAAVQLERLGSLWHRRGLVMLPGTTSRFAIAVSVSMVVVLLAAALVPALTSTDVSGRLFGGPNSAPGSGHGGGPGTGGVNVAYSRSTIPGGSLVESNTPELRYTTSQPGGSYLAMATDSVFAGGAWLPYDDSVGGNVLDVLTGPGLLARDRDLADGGIGIDTTEVTATLHVTNDASGDGSIPFPGEADASSVAAQLTGVSGVDASRGIISVDSANAVQPFGGTTITTAGTTSTATVAQLRAAGTEYPAFIHDDGFLTLPDDGTGGVAAITTLAKQWTAGTTNAFDAATAIEETLRDPTQFSYTLDPDLPPGGSSVWPVVYFLTTTHAAYCQYFASAMGAMLRAIGIPSRLVNGYGPGNLVDTTPAPGGVGSVPVYGVTSNDAHTWVQAYFPRYGWIAFEPTPSSPQGDYQPFRRGGAITATPTPAAASTKPHRGNGSGGGSNAATPAGGGTAKPLPATPFGWALGGLILLALAVVVWALAPRSVAGVWRRVAVTSWIAGIRRDPSATYREAAARLGSALAAPGSAASLRLADLVTGIGATSDRLSYGPVPPGRAEVTALVRSWRSLARGLPRAALAGLRRRRRPVP